MASTSKAASGQPKPERTKKRTPKKKVKKTVPVPVPSNKKRIDSVTTSTGEYEVGRGYEVLHYSSLRWQFLKLQRIEQSEDGKLTFSFFSNPPGWMAVGEDRVRQPKKTKRHGEQKIVGKN